VGKESASRWGSTVTASQERSGSLELKPLPYQEGIRAYLKAEEPEVWDWFASNKVRDDQSDSVRFDLLKLTYRVERETQPDLYEAAEDVTTKLALDVPVTFYQAQNPTGLNASLAYLPDEAHIIFHGPIASRLTNLELRALLGHELSHLLLWRGWEGDYIISDQILAALTHDSRAETPHFASARLFRLYTEIFCDRGSLYVVEDPLVVVSMLVKIQTGLEDVSAESYVRQAEEIFSNGKGLSQNSTDARNVHGDSNQGPGFRIGTKPKADQLTHPEAFIRTRAVQFWAGADQDADAKIVAMIEGTPALDELDLLGQQKVAALTRRLIDVLLAP
jgi:hypothetical protein